MTFYSNGVQLGPPVAVDSSIIPPVAGLNTNQLPIGQNSVSAQYSGDTNYTGSTSAASLIDVVMGTEVGLTASSTTIQLGQSVTFTAQVGPLQNGGPVLTGTITFTANGANLGGPVNLPSTGQAQITTNSLPSGPVQIFANYGGDANYSASSATLMETVTGPPTFTISANPTMLTVAGPGQSAETTLTFTPQNGFTGSATLSPSACSNLPPESSCSFSLSTINFTSSSAPVPVTFTVTTTASSLVLPNTQRFMPGSRMGFRQIAVICFVGLYIFLLVNLVRQHRVRTLAFAFIAAIACATAGCGGGSGGVVVGNPGTPAGNYTGVTVTLTINGVTKSINNLTVDVQ